MKRKARVRAETRYPSEYDRCPGCGNYKVIVSALCRSCRFPRPDIEQPDNPMIRYLALNRGYVAVVPANAYDRIMSVSRRWHVDISYKKDGSVDQIYASVTVHREGVRKKYKLHRVILGIDDPNIRIDHKDHDGLNCNYPNLRIASAAQNVYNSRPNTRNKSGYKGVSWDERLGKWKAGIRCQGRYHYLGLFPQNSLLEAARAYDDAAKLLFGDFAFLNLPENAEAVSSAN